MSSRLIDLTGKTFGRLTVLRRVEDRVYGGGHREPWWEVRCICGPTIETAGARLRNGQAKSCGCLSRELTSERSRKEIVRYRGAHARVEEARGPAAAFGCSRCDRRADEWAYMHDDPAEITTAYTAWGKPATVRYSLDPVHYQPMCHSCHVSFDRGSRAAS